MSPNNLALANVNTNISSQILALDVIMHVERDQPLSTHYSETKPKSQETGGLYKYRSMEVEAAVETPLVFAGEQVRLSVTFIPPANCNADPPSTLLSGYAVVQGSFRPGDMLLSEPFADTRKQGIVLTRRGIEYGQPQNSVSLFSGMLDGLKSLVVTAPTDQRSADGNHGNMTGKAGDSSGNMPSGSSIGSHQTFGGRDHEEGDYPVFATSQLLLFTDLKLTKPEKFTFSVDLPEVLPSTYKSRSLQITYSLVIGFERIRLDANSKPIDPVPHDTRLFLPFRLLSKPPTPSNSHPPKFDLRKPINAPPPRLVRNGQHYSEHSEEENRKEMSEFFDDLLNGSSQIERRKRSSSIAHLPGAHYVKVCYDINKNRTPIAQLILAKPATYVGDVLAAQIRIKRPCLHISIYLELEEQIEGPYAALTNTSGSTGHNTAREDQDQELEVATTYTIYARQFQGVYGLKELPVYLPTLTSITPRLDTQQLVSTWSLRIEFYGLVGTAFAADEEMGLLAKGQVDHEMFTCRIPVVILPPSIGSGGQGVAKTWKY